MIPIRQADQLSFLSASRDSLIAALTARLAQGIYATLIGLSILGFAAERRCGSGG